ncbi:MAG: zinc-dependent metalloprotease [Oligoflexus sp.]
MKVNNQYLRLVWSAMLMLSALTACEKRRDTKFTQGDGEYLYEISAYDGKQFSLRTGEPIAPGISSNADELVVAEDNRIIRNFPAVSFEAESDILKISNEILNNFDFYGRPNHEYKVEFGFTEDHLIVYKIASESDLPSFELTYAQPRGGDLFAVPMMGFPLGKYAIERVEDSRGKATDRKKSFQKDFLRESTHFSITETGVKYFEADNKVDLFPVEFFTSDREWFYEITLVDRPMDDGTEFLGFQYELGMQYGSGRIKFFRTNNSIIGVDVNIPDEALTLDGVKLRKVVEIPTNWVDFRLVTSGNDAYLKEETLKEREAGSLDWKNRKFGLLDFRGVNALGTANLNNIKLQRLDVDDDYLSFTVFDSNSGLTFRYSFSYSDFKVAGIQYPIEDMNRFGFFRSQKQVYGGALTASEESIQQRLFVNRMYDDNNEIVFHLTDNSPDDDLYVDAVQRAVDAWDKAFAEAAVGTPYENNPIRVRFNQEKRVKNGDARYHKVSFYGYDIYSRLLGYGPSVSDNRNGQIYSSTNHIYLRNYREGILRNLVTYVRSRIGLYDDKFVDGIEFPNQVLAVAGAPSFDDLYPGADVGFFAMIPGSTERKYFFRSAQTAAELDKHQIREALSEYHQQLVHGQATRLPSILDPRKNAQNAIDVHNHKHKDMSKSLVNALAGTDPNNYTCEYYQAGLRNTFDEIEDYCMRDGSRFKSYVENLVSQREAGYEIFRLEDEIEVFYECAQRLMKPTLISTLVHEFGHNFGLTHNFRGSADYDNFRRDENGVPLVRSTSVMDYADRDSDRGIELGTYDVAAIRYAYYQAVEVDGGDGSYEVVDISRPFNDIRDVSAVLRDKGFDPNARRHYKYCWDYNIEEGEMPQVEPDCRRWDQGSNPIQAVLSKIDQFNTFMVTSGHRFDNIGLITQGGVAGNLLEGQLMPMKAYYDSFRAMVRNQPGSVFREDPYYFDNEGSFRQEMAKVIDEANLKYYVPISAEYAAEMEKQNKVNLFSVMDGLEDPRERSMALEKVIMTDLTEIQRYKLAADISFKFMKELLFSDIQYCVVNFTDASIAPRFVPFEQFRSDYYYKKRVKVDSCNEAEVALFEEYGTIGEIASIETVGNRIDDVLHTPDTQALQVKNPLSVGMEFARLVAASVLADRSPGLLISAQNNFLPNYLDNPIYRDIVAKEFQKRLVSGVDPKSLLGEAANGLKPITRYFEERDLYSTAWSFFIIGLVDVPGAETAARARPYLPNVLPPGSFLGRIPEDAILLNDVRGNIYWAGKNLPFVKSIMEIYSELNDDLLSANTTDLGLYLTEEGRTQGIQSIAQVVFTGVTVDGQETIGPTNMVYTNYISALAILQEYYGLVPADKLADYCGLAVDGLSETPEEQPRCAPEMIVDLPKVLDSLPLTQESKRFVLGSAEVIGLQGWPASSLAGLGASVLSYVQVSYPDFNGKPDVYTEDDIVGFISQNFQTNGLFRAVALDSYREVRTKYQNAVLNGEEMDLNTVLIDSISRIFSERLVAAQEVLENKEQYEAQERILRSMIGIQ